MRIILSIDEKEVIKISNNYMDVKEFLLPRVQRIVKRWKSVSKRVDKIESEILYYIKMRDCYSTDYSQHFEFLLKVRQYVQEKK